MKRQEEDRDGPLSSDVEFKKVVLTWFEPHLDYSIVTEKADETSCNSYTLTL